MNLEERVTAAHLPSDKDSPAAARKLEAAEVGIHRDKAEAVAEKELVAQVLELGSARHSYLAELAAVRSPC